ncbi:MAG: hypothetical protein ABJE81_05310 [Pseudophaeobacter sp.]|uniref:DUF2946 family protein n=2 Tax=Pseudophaeobacter sp. TaxID=1971739 RepID=UPI00326493B1
MKHRFLHKFGLLFPALTWLFIQFTMSGLVLGSSANAMQIEICSPSGVQLITIDPNTGEPSEPTAKGGGCDWCQSFGHFIDTSARDDLNWVVLNLSYQQNLALAPPLHKPLRLIADYQSRAPPLL